ncbi:SDR family NAD(P)-dependent oxidoreductase (plasmid) [Limimaricola variabilis]
MTRPLSEQRVVVTGAAQGLGAAIARAFAAEGAALGLIDVDRDGLEAVGRETGGAIAVADLSDPRATRDALAAVTGGRSVDTLIHNAAILRPEPFAAVSFETFRATLDVGLQAGFLLTQGVWDGMRSRGGGALIFVSSQSGIRGFADETAYCAAKHGLEGLSKCLAMEGEAAGILSCTVTPGMAMRTPMSERNYPPELKRTWVEPDRLAPAFLRIAAERRPDWNGRRLDAWQLSQETETT